MGGSPLVAQSCNLGCRRALLVSLRPCAKSLDEFLKPALLFSALLVHMGVFCNSFLLNHTFYLTLSPNLCICRENKMQYII